MCVQMGNCLQNSFGDFVLIPKILPLLKNKNIYQLTRFELFLVFAFRV